MCAMLSREDATVIDEIAKHDFLNGASYGFIGFGKMARAIASGLSSVMREAHGLAGNPGGDAAAALPRFVATFRSAEREQELLQQPGQFATFETSTDNRVAASTCDVLFICCKPQNFQEVAQSIAGHIKPDSLVVSIMAGVTLEKLAASLATPAVVRAMPNVCTHSDAGTTVWTDRCESAYEETWKVKRRAAHLLLAGLGTSIYVDTETYLDVATAISGTGPAYIFLFMECLVDAGVRLGLPRRLAYNLAISTLKGSGKFIQEFEHESLSELRYKVTSPGGTTASAIYEADKGGIRTVIADMVAAAYERSRELAD